MLDLGPISRFKTQLNSQYSLFCITAYDTVNHIIFACSLFRDFVNENLFAEI